MDLAIAILAALLSLFPGIPRDRAACVARHRDDIAGRAWQGASERDVPVALLLSVAYLETHLGCDPASGGNWGAPVDPRHRHTAGTSHHAASSLAWGWRRCGTWLGAMSHFRCGLCRCPASWYTRVRRLRGYTPEDAIGYASMVEDAAALPARAW